MSKFPLRHLSVRVPWHDTGWNGRVCASPQFNGACTKLKAIAAAKDDANEILLAGKSLEEIPRGKWPCCVSERSTFMAPFELDMLKRHALAQKSPRDYGHFEPTLQRYPAYSFGIVPFRWVMRDYMEENGKSLELDVDINREPKLGYKTNWVHEANNQTAMLDAFAAHLREEESICLIYAKNVPFFEGTGRILIGVGKVKKIGKLTEYLRKDNQGLQGVVWERPVQHSIRPLGTDGFLMPYHQLLARMVEDSSLDMSRYTAMAPEEHWDEYSYGSELVTHDGAIGGLLSLDIALARIKEEQGIDTSAQRQWIHTELVRLWKVRGPYPGLGAVLTAFGLSRGVFVAHALQEQAGENADPWPWVDKAFQDPKGTLPKGLRRDIKELAQTWILLPEERRQYLKLLSRFELTAEQADALYEEGKRQQKGWLGTDLDILNNPYRLYELTRHSPDGLRLLTVDRGVFPDDIVRLKHPLPQPSALESAVDVRRIRAFTISALEDAASSGHTLLPGSQVVDQISHYPISPPCPLTQDILDASEGSFITEIIKVMMDGKSAFQLKRYQQIRELLVREVKGRLKGVRLKLPQDWSMLLEQKFGSTTDDEERRAREEKSAALKELAEARFSVLVGPAGAGKTTVLGLLCSQPQIIKEGLLLLAPTGKARVRMQELATENGVEARTLAQFLIQNGRYDGATGRYFLSERPKAKGYATVIVDECSMLTEDMLGALLNALDGVKRLILVGDPAQLPPIGAGRPFVDIIAHLKPSNVEAIFPRVDKGYAELTIERRQVGQDRPDLRFVRWFSTTPPSVGEDDLFSAGDNEHQAIRFVSWKTQEDFQKKLLDVLVDELSLKSRDDIRGFNRSLGAVASGDYDYFNATRGEKIGSVNQIEAWQILTPLRGMPFGVADINRQIHSLFRQDFVELATRQRRRSIPKPMGIERIVYGDKVINLSNHKRDGNKVYPQEGALGYLANGEIGLAVGQWSTNANPKILKIEFASQKRYTYDFYASDFQEEGDAVLELAYALTVHKSQGSQFKIVIVVLPESHPILSRELIYTALTRHQDKVVLMHQGSRTLLKDFTAPHHSETAQRMTNLFQDCRMLEIPLAKTSLFMQEGLVHRTSRGLAVRSKSELIICEALAAANIDFEYEKPLSLADGTRYPDFTIDDAISGRVYYWEHLGMLDREDYRKAWERKLKWYRDNDILPVEEGGGENGTLLTTTESLSSGFDVASVSAMIKLIQE